MIGRLRGELLDIEGNTAVVEACGVGYEVLVPDSVLHQLPLSGEPVDLYTRQIFREDGVTLYGFVERFQRRLFDLLMTVNGCGPKAALSLIGQIGEDSVAAAILSQDAKVLTRASGVGPKLAERIILELRNKIQEESLQRKIDSAVAARRVAPVSDELIDALLALGYRRQEAETAAADAREASTEVQVQLREALKLLRK